MPFRHPAAAPPAFTLVEVLVSTTVLALLVFLVARLFSSALSVTTLNGKRMDADEQARVLFDRMAIDLARMVKRGDVDYYLKQPANPMRGSAGAAINDQIAFYSEVPGYYPSPGTTAAGIAQSPVSLVAYRVNADQRAVNYQKVERLGKGLLWNGVSAADSPVLFLPVPLASPPPTPTPAAVPTPTPTPPPSPAWPQAGNSDPDPNYELVGPQVFRLEYYYQLKGQTVGGVNCPSVLSDTPWDIRPPINHTAVNGLQDVAAIAVTVAVIDPQSHVLVSDAQLHDLAGQFGDFIALSAPGTLESGWQTAVNQAISPGVVNFPPEAARGVRIYHRYFYLNLPQ